MHLTKREEAVWQQLYWELVTDPGFAAASRGFEPLWRRWGRRCVAALIILGIHQQLLRDYGGQPAARSGRPGVRS